MGPFFCRICSIRREEYICHERLSTTMRCDNSVSARAWRQQVEIELQENASTTENLENRWDNTTCEWFQYTRKGMPDGDSSHLATAQEAETAGARSGRSGLVVQGVGDTSHEPGGELNVSAGGGAQFELSELAPDNEGSGGAPLVETQCGSLGPCDASEASSCDSGFDTSTTGDTSSGVFPIKPHTGVASKGANEAPEAVPTSGQSAPVREQLIDFRNIGLNDTQFAIQPPETSAYQGYQPRASNEEIPMPYRQFREAADAPGVLSQNYRPTGRQNLEILSAGSNPSGADQQGWGQREDIGQSHDTHMQSSQRHFPERLSTSHGYPLSDNEYLINGDTRSYRQLHNLPPVHLNHAHQRADDYQATVEPSTLLQPDRGYNEQRGVQSTRTHQYSRQEQLYSHHRVQDLPRSTFPLVHAQQLHSPSIPVLQHPATVEQTPSPYHQNPSYHPSRIQSPVSHSAQIPQRPLNGINPPIRTLFLGALPPRYECRELERVLYSLPGFQKWLPWSGRSSRGGSNALAQFDTIDNATRAMPIIRNVTLVESHQPLRAEYARNLIGERRSDGPARPPPRTTSNNAVAAHVRASTNATSSRAPHLPVQAQLWRDNNSLSASQDLRRTRSWLTSSGEPQNGINLLRATTTASRIDYTPAQNRMPRSPAAVDPWIAIKSIWDDAPATQQHNPVSTRSGSNTAAQNSTVLSGLTEQPGIATDNDALIMYSNFGPGIWDLPPMNRNFRRIPHYHRTDINPIIPATAPPPRYVPRLDPQELILPPPRSHHSCRTGFHGTRENAPQPPLAPPLHTQPTLPPSDDHLSRNIWNDQSAPPVAPQEPITAAGPSNRRYPPAHPMLQTSGSSSTGESLWWVDWWRPTANGSVEVDSNEVHGSTVRVDHGPDEDREAAREWFVQRMIRAIDEGSAEDRRKQQATKEKEREAATRRGGDEGNGPGDDEELI